MSAAVYPGISAAAAATANTLYGDIAQYDDPAPRVLVHHAHGPSPSASVTDDEAEADGAGGGTGLSPGSGAGAGSGGPLTLSSGGPGSSAFSSYVAANTKE